MSDQPYRPIKQVFQKNMLESAIRIGLVALLLIWCVSIIRPFLDLVLWGAILAVAFFPAVRKLTALLGGRQSLACTLFVLAVLAALLIPITSMMMGSAQKVQVLAAELQAGEIQIPPPNENVATWPIVGEPLYELWQEASGDIEELLKEHRAQLEAFSKWLLSAAGASAAGILKLILSLIVTGVLMAKAEPCRAGMTLLMNRLLGESGASMVSLATATIRSVAVGVVGVAAIQAIGAGVGFMLMGIPLAGLWAFITLLVAVVQLPPMVVFLPIIAYAFSVAETGAAVVFTVWLVLVGISDTFLKPLLMGRGVDVPMLVILIGAIGGMVVSGIVGLFIGAVVLALTWRLFVAWLHDTVPNLENRT